MAASVPQDKPKAAGATLERSFHAVLPELWNGRSTVVHGCAGKSREASPEKRTIDGAAGGSIISTRVGGGIGAGPDDDQGETR